MFASTNTISFHLSSCKFKNYMVIYSGPDFIDGIKD